MVKRNGGFDPGIHDPASVDNIPLEVPLEFREPPSIQDEIRRFIRIEMSRQAEEAGFETFEEANDLEFSDDDDFSSANELTEDQEMAMMSVARSSRDNGGNHGSEENDVGRSGVDGGGRKPAKDGVGHVVEGVREAGESSSGAAGGAGNKVDGGGHGGPLP